MSDVAIDWKSATVKGGTLTVKLTGDADPTWNQAFSRAAKQRADETRLEPRGWGEVAFNGPGVLRVLAVRGEDPLPLQRHLEELVSSANAQAPRDRQAQRESVEAGRREKEERAQAEREASARFQVPPPAEE